MAKIDKNANLYDKDGNLLKKAPLTTPTIYELEEELKKWTNMAKEHPENEDYRIYLNNTYASLMAMYRRYGNPHEKELIEKINNYEKEYGEIKGEMTSEQVKEALNTLAKDIEEPKETVMDEYIQFEEVNDEV